MLTDEEITRVLLDTNEPSNACRQLVSKANDAGGKDNITAVVADFRVAASAEDSRHSVTNVVDLGQLSHETPADRIDSKLRVSAASESDSDSRRPSP